MALSDKQDDGVLLSCAYPEYLISYNRKGSK